MPVTQSTILPAGRDWTAVQESVATTLIERFARNGDELAALALLFRAPEPVWADGRAVSALCGSHPWAYLHEIADLGLVRMTDETRAMVLLACSMADTRCPTRLRDQVRHLTDDSRRALAEAIGMSRVVVA